MKVKSILLSVIAVSGAILLTSAAANAQRPNPSQQEFDKYKSQGPCSDPWVTIAVIQARAGTREPYGLASSGECDPNLYGNNWSNFNELFNIVEGTLNDMDRQREKFQVAFDPDIRGTSYVVRLKDGNIISKAAVANSLIGLDGGTLKSMMNRMVAAGAGNMVAAGAGNMVAAGSLNLKNITAAQLNALPNLRIVVAAGGYNTQSVNSTRLRKSVITQ